MTHWALHPPASRGERCSIFMLVLSMNVLRYHKEMALERLDHSQNQSHQVKAPAGLADRLSQVSGAGRRHNLSILNQAKSSCSRVKVSFDDAIGALKLPAGRITPKGFRGICLQTFAKDSKGLDSSSSSTLHNIDDSGRTPENGDQITLPIYIASFEKGSYKSIYENPLGNCI